MVQDGTNHVTAKLTLSIYTHKGFVQNNPHILLPPFIYMLFIIILLTYCPDYYYYTSFNPYRKTHAYNTCEAFSFKCWPLFNDSKSFYFIIKT
jgi:hypothetical protein